MKKSNFIKPSVLLASMLAATQAHATAMAGATTGSLPWDGPIASIINDLSGSIAKGFIIGAIVVTGLMWAFGEHGSSMKKVMGIAAGGALALGAVSFVGAGFFGGTGGAIIGF
jgi:type IV secretion system protein VirB2